MKIFSISVVALLCVLLIQCQAQTGDSTQTDSNLRVGGGCDGCELMFVGMPKNISSVSTSPGWNEAGQKLIISGTLFQSDGSTVAPNVILYYWQTDNNGYYSPAPDPEVATQRHGHIRGWVKTDAQGSYTIKTIRPAPYPNDVIPAHIHISIKEPRFAEPYYTDEINFEDDTLITAYYTKYAPENRGGSGRVRLTQKNGILSGTHNIQLGLNIPNYTVQ